MPPIQSVKGTRDFFPENLAFRRWLYENIRRVSEAFGYQEYDGPFLERLELYAAKSGEELVKEQAYVFPDRGGDLIALRPELTPSLARMVAQRARAMPAPIRWWSFGPFWRYEQPQKGRTREFFQWNIDLLGLDRPQADAELAAIAATFFRRIGLGPDQIVIRVNNRRLVDQQLSELGLVSTDRSVIFKLIDRRGRLGQSDWLAYGRELGLSDENLEAILQLLGDTDGWQRSDELVQFFEAVNALGVEDYLRYDPAIIRGLDYYTGTVFEATDAVGELRAILGGGRYDDLVADVGGDPVPGVGFAMGDVVIELVLKAAGALPELRPSPAQVLVTNFEAAMEAASLQLAGELREAGLLAEWYPQASKLAKQFRYADRYGIPLVTILGPDELAANQVALKDMVSGEQRSVARTELADEIRRALGASGRL
jgi:histidyl-tRNA synthetase